MKFINKLENKFGRYAVKNLSMYVIGAYIIGYLLQIIDPEILDLLLLKPDLVLKGQVWRIFTWIVNPPTRLDVWTALMLFAQYSFGTTLERAWGRFHFTLYMFLGFLFTVIGVMAAYAIINIGSQSGVRIDDVYLAQNFILSSGWLANTYYINMTVFLGYALTFPESRIYMYFLVPVKAKWLALFYAVIMIGSFVESYLVQRVIMVSSLLNLIIFFIMTKKAKSINPKEIKRKRSYRKEVIKSSAGALHKCTVCGKTEEDDESLSFRYCSKCEGNYEYCQEHLFTHEHKKN
jgi:hypothetical protein